MQNPYHILEVSRSATSEELHKAFRRKAKALHPDTHANDPKAELAFKDLTQAYALLNDAANRQLYDRGYVDFYGNPINPEEEKASAHTNGTEHGVTGGGFFGWGNGGRKSHAGQGRDVNYELEVPFETAICGGDCELLLKTGKKISVQIPAGAETGQILRLKSMGTTKGGFGAPGDALVELVIGHSPLWLRDGDNIRMRAGVNLKTAVLGGQTKISSPNGDVLAKIPSGTNTGTILRIKGEGVQKPDAPGDLLVRLEIVLTNPKAPDLKAFAKML